MINSIPLVDAMMTDIGLGEVAAALASLFDPDAGSVE